jgi:hypothetical protein
MNNAYSREMPQQKSISELEREREGLLVEINLIDLELNKQRHKKIGVNNARSEMFSLR